MKIKIDQNRLVWKSEYSIGNYKIDNEHIKLFEIAKKALNAKKKNKENKKELKVILKSLYEYSGTHFKNEESFMNEIQYPDLQKHKKIHKKILESLHNFVQTLNKLSVEEIEIRIYKFIEDYFIGHILHVDKKIELWNKSLPKLRKSTNWIKEYETGNQQIDEEHKELFDILNKAFEEVDDEEREQKIKDVLKHLYDFMKIHFKVEEKYMMDIDYPDFEAHLQLHNNIIHICNTLVLKINNMEDSLFEKELAMIIDTLLIEHILKEDSKIVKWENSNIEKEF